jgi:hypothetical protein
MLKWLTISSAAILIAALVLMVRYDQIHDTKDKGYDIKCTQSSDPSTTMNDLVCTAEHSQKAESSKSSSQWWHVFFAWPEGITALLIALTLGAITWQSWETRKAAEAAINSDRAWILADLGWHQGCPPNYQMCSGLDANGEWGHSIAANIRLDCKNEGRCPAWIESIQARMEIATDASRLAKNGELQSFDVLPPMGVGVERSAPLDLTCPGKTIDLGKAAYILVVIKYWDGFGVKGITSVGYRLSSGGTLSRDGIPSRNYNT